MESGNVADWVSAIGSLLAVGVSVGLYAASQADRRASDASNARNAALMVLPHFRDAERSLTWSLEQLQSGKNPSSIGVDESGANISIGHLRREFGRFSACLPAIAQLGAAVRDAQVAFQHYRELSEDLEGYEQQDVWPGDRITYDLPGWTKTYDLLRQAEERVRKAVSAITRLLQ